MVIFLYMVMKMLCTNFLALLLFLKFHRSAVAISSYNKCDIKQPSRGILDLKLPSKPARLLNATSAFSLKNCSKSCCDAINCNAYIWRNSEQCFLFQCKVLEDCKVVPYQGTITGFVTRNVALSKEEEHLHEEPVAKLVPAQQTVSNTISIEKENSKTLEHKSTVNSKSDIPAEQEKKTLGSNNASDKEEYLDRGYESKRTSQGHNVTSKISKHKNTTAAKGALSKKKSGSSKNVTASAIPVLNSSLSSQKVTHTTTTSLVAALSFGMVFFITVAVLIGRPWWQSFSVGREGYNRVAFLMNGT